MERERSGFIAQKRSKCNAVSFSCRTNHAIHEENIHGKDCRNKYAIALFLYRLFYEEQGLSLLHYSTECYNHILKFVLNLK
jgi:hypothetical protein